MIRFLHTADWQLGMTFPGYGKAADWLGAARYQLVDSIVELALRRGLDLVLVAGDVFDSPQISGARIREVCLALGRMAPIPVYLLAGNHDPLQPGGLWHHPEWAERPDNVHLCGDDPIPLEQLGAVIYPCPLHDAHSGSDPTANLPASSDAELIRIGLAHGALPISGQTGNHPIELDRPAIAALDYLALGDWHSALLVNDRVAYAGTPEPTRFGERNSGTVLVVEIAGPGEIPQVEVVSIARTDWRVREARIETADDVSDLQGILDRIARPAGVVLELRLSGAPTLEALSRLEALELELGQRFGYFRAVRDGLLLRPDPAEIALLASGGPLGRAVQRIAAELESDPATRPVAEAALRVYYEFVHA